MNRHTDLDEPLFNKCAHGDIPDRTWIDPGIVDSFFFNVTWFQKACLINLSFHHCIQLKISETLHRSPNGLLKHVNLGAEEGKVNFSHFNLQFYF